MLSFAAAALLLLLLLLLLGGKPKSCYECAAADAILPWFSPMGINSIYGGVVAALTYTYSSKSNAAASRLLGASFF